MKAIDYILAQVWAMLPEHVAQIIDIAERANLDPEAVAAKLGRPLDNARKVDVRDGVAVIPVRGVIARYANLFTEICDGTSVDVLAKDFRTALDSPAVHSIILEIDSPGGQAAGIGELAGQIREGSKVKPVVCYVSNLGASAGYWLASAGSEVVASPSAILGSVGVVLPVAKDSGAGRTIEFVSSKSPNKRPDPGTEVRPRDHSGNG
jgi:ClpP class serine protease